ncbi:MAG: hypothetical protein ACLTMP_06105 [Eggerthella lenta]
MTSARVATSPAAFAVLAVVLFGGGAAYGRRSHRSFPRRHPAGLGAYLLPFSADHRAASLRFDRTHRCAWLGCDDLVAALSLRALHARIRARLSPAVLSDELAGEAAIWAPASHGLESACSGAVTCIIMIGIVLPGS